MNDEKRADEKHADEKHAFDTPRLAINRVYTRGGDDGTTCLAGGQRLPKNALRIEAYGTVDELNSLIGLARESVREAGAAVAPLAAILLRVQHELFNLGSELATLPEDLHPNQARITASETEQLEREIDHMNADLPPLRSFVLPGGSRLNAELHLCRTVCRRAERTVVSMSAVSMSAESPLPDAPVRYLNRLSDALFVWCRWASHRLGTPETLWEPNKASSQALT